MSSPSVDLALQLPPYPDRFELAAKFAGAPLHEKLTQVSLTVLVQIAKDASRMIRVMVLA